ncbi:hypothetical protein ANN_00635 [Periplaneta americana]|uniref:Uncharacterized protein n=1 Tax=Periplaneta americana TaxID=6978 RepID=A0ABQ8TTR6_PERAM|nr:hypothetical protein ANN_00635 [Periplaneta americana]
MGSGWLALRDFVPGWVRTLRHALIHCTPYICDDCSSLTGDMGGIRESDADRWAILPQSLLEPDPVSWTSTVVSPRSSKSLALSEYPTLTDEGDNASEMSPELSIESYPAFALNGLRENAGKNLSQEGLGAPDLWSSSDYSHADGNWLYQGLKQDDPPVSVRLSEGLGAPGPWGLSGYSSAKRDLALLGAEAGWPICVRRITNATQATCRTWTIFIVIYKGAQWGKPCLNQTGWQKHHSTKTSTSLIISSIIRNIKIGWGEVLVVVRVFDADIGRTWGSGTYEATQLFATGVALSAKALPADPELRSFEDLIPAWADWVFSEVLPNLKANVSGTCFRERHCDDTPLAGQRQIQMERNLTPVSERVGVGGGRKQKKCIAIIASHNVLFHLPEDTDALLSGCPPASRSVGLAAAPLQNQKMVVEECQVGTVGRLRKIFPPKCSDFLHGDTTSVKPRVIVLQDDLLSRAFLAQCTTKLQHCLNIADIINLWSVQVQEIQPECILELINSFLFAFRGGSSRETATRLILDVRVPIFEMFHPSPNTAVAHAHISVCTLKSKVNFSSRFFFFNEEFNDSTLSKRAIVVDHFANIAYGHIIEGNDVTICQYIV